MITRFNDWYDSLREPWRFLFFLGLICLSVLPLHLGVILAAPKLMMAGLLSTLAVCFIAAMRAMRMGNWHAKVGPIIIGITAAAMTATTVALVHLM